MLGGEIQIDVIVRYVLVFGKEVFVFYFYKNLVIFLVFFVWVMDMVCFKDLVDYEGLMLDRWGILSINLVIVYERQRVFGGLDVQYL